MLYWLVQHFLGKSWKLWHYHQHDKAIIFWWNNTCLTLEFIESQGGSQIRAFFFSNMRWKVSYFVKMVLNSHHFCQAAPPLDYEHLLSIKTVCNSRTGNFERHFSKSCCGFRADKWYLSKMVLFGVQTMAVMLRICVMKHSIHAVCQYLIGDTTATSYIDTSPYNTPTYSSSCCCWFLQMIMLQFIVL